MADTIAVILGINVNQVTKVKYLAVDKEKDHEILDTTAAGHLIFNYDPKDGHRKHPSRAWRIIWENRLIDADQWAPPAPAP